MFHPKVASKLMAEEISCPGWWVAGNLLVSKDHLFQSWSCQYRSDVLKPLFTFEGTNCTEKTKKCLDKKSQLLWESYLKNTWDPPMSPTIWHFPTVHFQSSCNPMSQQSWPFPHYAFALIYLQVLFFQLVPLLSTVIKLSPDAIPGFASVFDFCSCLGR